MFVAAPYPRYTRKEAGEAIATSLSFAEALRKLGMRPAGGNHATLKKYAERWGFSTDHFDPHAASRPFLGRFPSLPLETVLVENSTYNRGNLKRRLYAEGLKERRCELCGQDEHWHGRKMALILDHINGVATDNRLKNLRIVCPNCAATLETHCGRNKVKRCEGCRQNFRPNFSKQRFCSVRCHKRTLRGVARPKGRKRGRPPYRQLLAEIDAAGYCAVGRKYGVTDNTIRKWVRQYRRERARRMLYAGRMRAPVTIVLRRAPRRPG